MSVRIRVIAFHTLADCANAWSMTDGQRTRNPTPIIAEPSPQSWKREHGTDASLIETRASIGSHTTAIKTIANPYGGRSEHATPPKWPRRKRILQGSALERAPSQISRNQGRKRHTPSRHQRRQARCTPRCRQRRRLSRRTHCSMHSKMEYSFFLIRGT